jgi:hypothetical protein
MAITPATTAGVILEPPGIGIVLPVGLPCTSRIAISSSEGKSRRFPQGTALRPKRWDPDPARDSRERTPSVGGVENNPLRGAGEGDVPGGDRWCRVFVASVGGGHAPENASGRIYRVDRSGPISGVTADSVTREPAHQRPRGDLHRGLQRSRLEAQLHRGSLGGNGNGFARLKRTPVGRRRRSRSYRSETPVPSGLTGRAGRR